MDYNSYILFFGAIFVTHSLLEINIFLKADCHAFDTDVSLE